MSDSKSTYGDPVEEPRPADDVVRSANEGLTDAEAAGREAAPVSGRPAEGEASDSDSPAVASEPVNGADAPVASSPVADSTDDEITDAAAYHAAYNASYDEEPAPAGSVATTAYETHTPATAPEVAPSEPVSEGAPYGAAAGAGAAAVGAGAATAAAAPQPIFVQAPEPPRARGNRGAAGAIGLLAALSFAVLFLAAWLGIGLVRGDIRLEGIVDAVTSAVMSWVFWTPVVLFFLGFWLLGAIINRGRWAHWVVFGIFVGLFSWFGFILGELFQAPFWSLTSSEGLDLIQKNLFAPLAVIAFIIGRELTIWFGAWVAARGRRVTELNTEAQREYERTLEAGPQLYRR